MLGSLRVKKVNGFYFVISAVCTVFNIYREYPVKAQRRYNVAETSRRCSDVVTTLCVCWVEGTSRERTEVWRNFISTSSQRRIDVDMTFNFIIISGEINVYLVKIKVISITSVSFHLWLIRFIFSLLALDDVGFLPCFRSGCYLHFRFLTPLTSLFLNKTIKCWYAFS